MTLSSIINMFDMFYRNELKVVTATTTCNSAHWKYKSK